MAKKTEQTRSGWGLVRPGAHRISLYDEGGALFFYDETSAPAIAADLPRSLGSPKDPAHARLAKAGRLVTVVLGGDGMAELELAVGPPLEGQELAVLPFLEAQEALLDLPSGRLHVETPSTIPIPRHDPDGDAGFVTQLEPGRYRLTIRRLDMRALERERDRGGAQGSSDGPYQFVTLTPITDDAEVPTPPVIPWIEPRDEWPAGRYAIEGPLFKGLARAGDYWDSLASNFDPAAARAMGLQPGAGLQVAIPDLSFKGAAIYSPDVGLFGFLVDLSAGEKKGMPGEFAVAHWQERDDNDQPYLRFWRIKTKYRFEERDWDLWRPAELRLEPAPRLAAAFLERIALTGPNARKALECHGRRLGLGRG